MLLYPLVMAFGPSAGGLRVGLDARAASPLMSEGARRKVVITGMGALTSLGKDPDTIFDNLLDGKCGIGRLTRFNPDDYPSVPQIASEVADFDVTKYWTRPEGRPDGVGFDPDKYDRYTHFAIAASLQCLRDAKLDPASIESPYRFGCNVASGAGGIGKLEANCEALFTSGESAVSGPDALGVSNTASQMVAMEVGARGPNGNYVSACASGTHALGEAFRSIAYDEADVMLAGGTEACITPLTIAGFNSMRAMCTTANDSPQTASRPFDADRCGFVMGEGAGVLLLESEEHALARGAKIYCELAGYAANCDAFHITAPHPEGEGMSACLLGALRSAEMPPESVGYINAHGTSTPLNDKFETLAYKVAFKDHAPKIKISSTKGAIGHLLGAAGGVEAAVCCKVLEKQQVPPTINYNTPDPDCDLDYVPNVKYVPEEPIEVAMSDNLGFGGHNAALVFKRYTPK
jgi:3-oxoacyl-[acyl-carrier-protein] synthase II